MKSARQCCASIRSSTSNFITSIRNPGAIDPDYTTPIAQHHRLYVKPYRRATAILLSLICAYVTVMLILGIVLCIGPARDFLWDGFDDDSNAFDDFEPGTQVAVWCVIPFVLLAVSLTSLLRRRWRTLSPIAVMVEGAVATVLSVFWFAMLCENLQGTYGLEGLACLALPMIIMYAVYGAYGAYAYRTRGAAKRDAIDSEATFLEMAPPAPPAETDVPNETAWAPDVVAGSSSRLERLPSYRSAAPGYATVVAPVPEKGKGAPVQRVDAVDEERLS